MATLKMRACLVAAQAISDADRDAVLERAEQYERDGIEANAAARMAAADVLAEMVRDRAEFEALAREQFPQAFAKPEPAVDRRAAKARARAKARMRVNPETDSMLEALAKMGGIRRDIMTGEFGMAPEEVKFMVLVGGLRQGPFRKEGGMGLDTALTSLQEVGYFMGVADEDIRTTFEEAAFAEIGGDPRMTPMGIARQAERRAAEEAPADPFDPINTAPSIDDFSADELEASGYAEADPEVKAAAQALLAEAESLGIDTEALREDAAKGIEDQSEDFYYARLQAITREAIASARDAARQALPEATRGSAEDRREAAGAEGGEEAQRLIAAYRAEFGKVPSGLDQAGFRAFHDRRRAADEALSRKLLEVAERGNGLLLPTKWGRGFVALHANPRTEGAWRTTYFTADMEPSGHMEYNRPEEAAASFRNDAEAPGAEPENDPLLEAQSEQDLRDKAEREQAGREAEAAEQRRLAARDAAEARRKAKAEEDARAERVRRERADAAVDGFQLGQEPPSAVVTREEAAGQRSVFDAPAPAAAPAERFEAGKALTKEQRKQVLASLVDVYKAKGAPREMKGQGRDGNERYGYVHSPELFEKSDITGAMVRYYVTLPDGRRAHPSELFPDYTQADIDKAMIEQETAERRDTADQQEVERIADAHAAATKAEAEASFLRRNQAFQMRDWRTGKVRTFVHFQKDGKFYAVVSDDDARMRRLERAGWKRDGAAPPSQPVEEQGPTTDDVGENLRYNRRNVSRGGIGWSDVAGMGDALKVREVIKAKVWPKPDYAAMIEAGTPPRVARAVKNVYDAVAGKPNGSSDEALKLYIDTIARLRGVIDTWTADDQVVSALTGEPSNTAATRADLLERLWPDTGAPRYSRWGAATQEGKEVRSLGGNKFLRAIQLEAADLRKFQDEVADGWPASKEAFERQGYKVLPTEGAFVVAPMRMPGGASQPVYYVRSISGAFEGKFDTEELAKKRIADLTRGQPFVLLDKRGRFQLAGDTEEAVRERAREMVAPKRKSDTGSADTGFALGDANRIGPERRPAGTDISAQQLMDTFGFRGVNFGRKGYIGDEQRQAYLNAAYDGLHDLADLVGVPPKALSLNGELGIAFGAQGRGGRAAAHFVPGMNEINLTRDAGAGTLAHEWGHALDHYFANMAGLARDENPFLSHHAMQPETKPKLEAGRKMGTEPRFAEALRPEILRAFKAVYEAMNKRPVTSEMRETQGKLSVTRAREGLDKWIAHMRKAVAKSAADVQAEFDQIADRLRAGDMGDGYTRIGRMAPLRKTVGDLAAVSRFKGDKAAGVDLPGNWKGIDGAASHLAFLLKRADADVAHEPQGTTQSLYAKESAAADGKKNKGYWNTEWEKFARAFETWVSDKLAAQQRANTFLSTGGERADDAGDNKMPYPRGDERVAMAKALDTLVGAIETRETDKGTEMFSIAEPWYERDTPSAYRREVALRRLHNKIGEEYANGDRVGDAFDAAMAVATPAEQSVLRALRKDDFLGYDYPHQAIRAIMEEPGAYDLSTPLKVAITKLAEPEGSTARFDIDAAQQPAETQAGGQASLADRTAVSALQSALRATIPDLVLDARPLPNGGAVGQLPSVADRAFAAAGEVARRFFDKRVVLYRANKPFANGVHSGKQPGVIFLSADTSRPAMAVMGHEMLHAMRKDRPDLYNTLNSRLATIMRDADLHGQLLNLKRRAKGWQDLDSDKLREELVADIVGDNFTDPEFWRLMAKDQPSGFRKVADAILKFLDDLIAKITADGKRPFGTDQFLTDVQAARAAVVDAMRNYSGGEVGAVTQSEDVKFSPAGPTDSAAFRRWFGDSKVVDANGEPLVVYHGTSQDFSTFRSQERYPSKKLYVDGKFMPKADGWDMGDDRKGAPDGIHYGAWTDALTMGVDEAIAFRERESASFGANEDGARHLADLRRLRGKKIEWRDEAHATGDGFYFSPAPSYSVSFSGRGATQGGQMMPVYLSIKNPIYLDSGAIEVAGLARNVAKYEAQGYDGAIFVEGNMFGTGRLPLEQDRGSYSAQIVAFRPEQIKSAIGNRGTFDPADPDIRFSLDSRTEAMERANTRSAMKQIASSQQSMRNALADVLGRAGAKVSWWDKTLGTQYAKAQKYPGFKKVFDAVQGYLEDTSTLANEAADAAPEILPKLETWKDLRKAGSLDERDAEAIAAPIFEGTLDAKRVFTDDELRRDYRLNDRQIGQYRQFLAAVATSLDQAVSAEVLRMLGDPPLPLRQMAMRSRAEFRRAVDAFLTDQAQAADTEEKRLRFEALQGEIAEKYERADQLKQEGYAPLMRFGRHIVNVADPETGESLFFGLYESKTEANRMARELAQDSDFKGAKIEQGMLSAEQYKLFSSVPLESLEMFAEAIGAEQSEVFQDYIRLAKNNRSALKRLIQRKGTAGFSQDVPRVLASFITSNARLAAGAMNLPQAKDAAVNIREGDVKDEAVKLIETVQNPTETAAAARSLLFMNFIGGSIASAVVNLTQPVTMTLPYLSQWGGLAKAGSRLMSAGKMAAAGTKADAELAAALKRAEDEGIVSPQEIHHLTAQAMATWGTNPIAKRLAFIWGAPFSLAEQFNRRVSFIAAYHTAREEGIADPFAFAEKAVIETQGLYNRGNAPNLARGAVGATALTFKQFSIHYLEWMGRMYRSGPDGKRAVIYALAILMLAAGTDGLPFADDLDDLIDTLTQALGINMPSKETRRRFIADNLGFGDEAADVVTRGLTALPGFPLDASLRMGMGNLLPATGILLRSNTDRSRDVLEVAGPAGSLAKQYIDAGQKVLQGDLGGAVEAALPVALQNVWKAADIWANGEYRDTRDRKVMDADEMDGLMKFVGFQPAEIARESQAMGRIRRSEQLAKNVEGEIAAKWARGVADNDQAAVREAREELADWNRSNPTSRIEITSAQIIQRVKKMRMDRSERFLRSVSPERRGEAERALAE